MIPKWGDLHEFGSVQALILMQPTLVPTRAQIADEYGELLRRVAEAEVRITKEVGVDWVRIDQVKELINAWYLKHPVDQPAVEEGKSYFLEATACQNERELPLAAKRKLFAAMKKKLGADPLALFTVTQEAVKATLGGAAVDEYFTKERTGPRKYKVVAKAPPAAAREKAA